MCTSFGGAHSAAAVAFLILSGTELATQRLSVHVYVVALCLREFKSRERESPVHTSVLATLANVN